ncbi:MAG: macro domain-containing protein [Anaerolineales bacterium]|nr:macro domain-containing protein [Anaerolineales bacterium]
MTKRLFSHELPSGQVLALEHGDLTQAAGDAIVNAANARLAHGGGLAGAIVRRGGQVIQDESDAWVAAHGPARPDRPALTRAGSLPVKAVIHAVGPVWHGGQHGEPEALRAAYASTLALAEAQGFRSLALASLSTGIFGYPVEQAAPIAVQSVVDFCVAHPTSALREIRFVLIDAPTLGVFQRELARRFEAPA